MKVRKLVTKGWNSNYIFSKGSLINCWKWDIFCIIWQGFLNKLVKKRTQKLSCFFAFFSKLREILHVSVSSYLPLGKKFNQLWHRNIREKVQMSQGLLKSSASLNKPSFSWAWPSSASACFFHFQCVCAYLHVKASG